MDRPLIEAKQESLRRCVDRLSSKTPPSADDLVRNPDLQDIIALNLQRAVQLCVDLAAHLIADTPSAPPATMAEHFDVLENAQIIPSPLAERMKKAVTRHLHT